MSKYENEEVDLKIFPGTNKKYLYCSEIFHGHQKLGYFTIAFVIKKNPSVIIRKPTNDERIWGYVGGDMNCQKRVKQGFARLKKLFYFCFHYVLVEL